MKLVSLLPDTTGYVALYDNSKDAELSPMFAPLMGWALYDNGDILAMVPTDDGASVPARDYKGQDGELTFTTLTCRHECDEHHE